MKLTEKQIEEREFQLKMSKIQIYSDKCHAGLSTKISFIIVFIGLIIFFYSFFVQALIEGKPYSPTGIIGISGTVGTTILTYFYLNNYIQKYQSDFKKISDMIEAVSKGDDLPPLEKLDSWK